MDPKAVSQAWLNSNIRVMPQDMITVKVNVKNLSVKRELEKIVASLEGFGLQEPGENSSDLLIMDIGENIEQEFEIISSLQNSGEVKEIYLTSPRTDSSLLIQALRTGAKEFIPQPIVAEDVKDALFRSKGRLSSNDAKYKRGKIIDVLGSKGGVGTTTIAVNLATSLIEQDRRRSVVLVDMNLIFGEIPIFLDIGATFNWGEVARNISRVDSTYLMGILSKHPSGVYVLPSPTWLDVGDVVTPGIIEKLFRLMQNIFDFIVIDSGQNVDEISLKILEMADTVLLVSILSLPCFINVRRLLETFQKLGYPDLDKVRIIINRYHKKSIITLKDAQESIKKKIYWLIPNDYSNSLSAINQGRTIASVAPDAEITANFRRLASTFLEKREEKKEKAGFFSFIKTDKKEITNK